MATPLFVGLVTYILKEPIAFVYLGKSHIICNTTWSDNNNKNGYRPDVVTVQLFADGIAYGSAVTLDDSNGWTYSWTNLQKYKAGKEISYTVQETAIPEHYQCVIEGSANDGFILTNVCTENRAAEDAEPAVSAVSAAPDTGDDSDINLWLSLIVLAGAALAVVIRYRRKKSIGQ